MLNHTPLPSFTLKPAVIAHTLPAITFRQVSPNPMAVPKPILLHLNRRPQRTFSQKLVWFKTSFFEKLKVKLHWWWPLTWLYGLYLIIIPNEREFYELQVVKNCGWLSTKALAEIWLKIDFLAGSNYEGIQHIMLKLTVGECLKREYVRTKFRQNPWGSCFFFVLIWHGMTHICLPWMVQILLRGEILIILTPTCTLRKWGTAWNATTLWEALLFECLW